MPKKIFCISIDDGNVEDKTIVKLLNKYGLKATFNLNSERFGDCYLINQHDTEIHHDRLTEQEAKELYFEHDINAHGLKHKKLISCTDEEVVETTEKDRVNLSKLFDREIIGLAYPGGAPNHDKRVMDIVKSKTNFQYARCGIADTVSFLPPSDFYEWYCTCHLFSPRLPRLIEEYENEPTDKDKVFVMLFHGYNFQVDGKKYGLPINDTYQWFEQILKKLSGCNFDFMTMKEAYKYLNNL